LDKPNDGHATTQAAKATGVGRQYVADVKKIAQKAADLVEKIRQGEVTI
jgi:hypothetical protein